MRWSRKLQYSLGSDEIPIFHRGAARAAAEVKMTKLPPLLLLLPAGKIEKLLSEIAPRCRRLELHLRLDFSLFRARTKSSVAGGEAEP